MQGNIRGTDCDQPQPVSSSFGPEQVLGEVEDPDPLVPPDLLGPLDPLDPLEPLDPLDPLLAWATLNVVIAGTA